MPSRSELEGMTRAELDALASSVGLEPTDYSTKTEVVDALEQSGGVEIDTFVADATIVSALARLIADLGPGQILIADPALAVVADNQAALLAHAKATNRVALISCADGNAAALTAVATALKLDQNARYGALFAPSAVIPGVVAGTTRTVPYTAVAAGIIARNDVAYTPNQPAAGALGQAVNVLDVQRFTDAEYAALNDAGVNMARVIYGGVRTYGYRTLVDKTTTPQWLNLGWARLNMAISAKADEIGERFVFSQLDGRRRTIAQFGGELSAMLAPYFDAGALYGDTPQDAYDVNVGVQVNTEATIANGELHAVISVRMSGMAEWVVIEIVKVATNQPLPAAA
jgi:phage tail sheath protein FI